MNERIRELAEQADGVVINKMMTGAKQYTFLEQDLEKFAELIVREMLMLTYDEETRYYNMNEDYLAMAIENYRVLVKEHFGVEE